MLKKIMISALSFVFALSVVDAVYAIGGASEPENSDPITARIGENEFLDDLNDDGYAELGKYKVEKIKDNIYHWDEGTKALPGGTEGSVK